MSEASDKLIVVVTASYKGALGFGDIFDCQIRRVLTGALDDPQIRLCILANEQDKLNYILAHPHPAELEIGFKVKKRGERYSSAPINGFVDGSKTSWEIEFIREASA